MRTAEGRTRKKSESAHREPDLYLTKSNFLPSVPGARRSSMPKSIQPMLATLIKEPFSDPEWVYEIKWDGIRAICFIDRKKMRLMSRNQLDIGFRYPEFSKIFDLIDADRAVLDGEIVVPDKDGFPSFQLLQSRMGLQDRSQIERMRRERPILYYVFDLLYYNGFDLTSAALIHRKAFLKEIADTEGFVRYSDHVLEKGEEFYEGIRQKRLEGMIAKNQGSLYVQKRSRDWLKVKTVLTVDVVIGGYTRPRGSRELLGSLLVGLYRDGQLHYVGHVGGGFNRSSLQQVFKILQKLKTSKCPFVKKPRTNEVVQWVKSSTVCEVKFSEWTADGKLRQPIFLGIREDKEPIECAFENAIGASVRR